AVSIKFAPSSTARRNTLSAFSRSGGQPQIPSPVSRIAPNPSRLTDKSPPILKLDLSLADAAAKSVAALPAKSDAPPASVARRNNRRLMPSRPTRSLFALNTSSFIARNLISHGFFDQPSLSSPSQDHSAGGRMQHASGVRSSELIRLHSCLPLDDGG